ncbi:hypothetical protein [Lactobacillus xylocopicola]|uniref:Uncharacterized protein n=1 Tax=Lactobacillus xylocopicola TaxID=2976676 RepID=A0ABM8BGF5_9LACO|nr:hypothetical protein [Lactobacillus xylocopicola]BDR60350.1 hypothetical protein KIM322_06110 [Lactobacillus xylocopicola]
MEIGPLSEWVTAFAEIAAVCIALFLPAYEKSKEKRKKRRNFKTIAKLLIKKALADQNTSSLETFLNIGYTLSDSGDEQVYSVARQALEILQDNSLPQAQKEAEISQLLKYLK